MGQMINDRIGGQSLKRLDKANLCTVAGVLFLTSVFAQDDPIVIDDLSLSELNDQIERVEDEFYRVFNLSIEEEHLKVECADWTPTGTHIAQRACQPHFLTQARNQNLRDWNNQMDVIASPEQLRVRLAAEFEELTAAINEVLEENQYFRELNAILRMLRERAQEID